MKQFNPTQSRFGMYALLVICFTFSCTFNVSAQGPSLQWQKCLGGTGDEQNVFSVGQTTDGGYIVGGWTLSNDGDVSGNHGNGDYWVVKTDAAGNIIWQKTLGGTGWDYLHCVIQTADGGYVVAGYTFSNNGDVSGHHNTASPDAWVVKLTSSGSITWQKALGGTSEDRATWVQQTADGGYIVSGYTFSNNGDVSGNHGGYDSWVVKLTSAGNIAWQKALGGTNEDKANCVQQTSDGGYIVASITKSSDGDVTGLHGAKDYWLVKLTAIGGLTWQKTFGGTSDEIARSVQQTSDGGYIVAGDTYSNDGDVTGQHGNADYWIVKMNGAGSLTWQKTLGGTSYDEVYSIQEAAEGGYVAVGSVLSNNGDVTGGHGGYDFWQVKLSTAGNLAWQKAFGGTSDEQQGAIRQTPDGGYIMAGMSNSNNGDVSGFHGGSGYDIWLAKLAPFKWIGTVSTTWTDGGNWTGGVVPSASADVIIPTGAPNYPYLTGNLTHNASIKIESGAHLKIDGILTNNGTITVNSGGSLVQTTGSTLAGTGTYNVKRAIANLTSFISSPINNEPVSGFGITPTGADGGQIVPSNCNPNSIASGSPYGNLLELRESPTVLGNCAQSLWFVKSSGNMTNGRGYSLRNGAATLNFTGTINNGTITYSGLTRQSGNINDGDGSTPTRGWHLVGNPYPSPITLTSGSLGAGFDNQLALYNNGSWISHSLTVSPITIAVGQGFQIRNSTPGTSPNFSLTNSLRVTGNPTFYSQGLLIDHYINVYLNNGTQSDKTIVYFIDNATDNFDAMYDANRMSDDIDLPMVYTVASAERLRYNALPTMLAGESKSVVLGIRTEVQGNHTLGFSDLITLDATTVMLEDLKLHTMQQVSDGDVYNFTTVAGDARERFVLHFSADITSGITTADKAGIPVFSHGNNIYINMKDIAAEENVTAMAYDLTGRLLFHEEVKGGSLFSRAVETSCADLIIVQLRNSKGETFRTKLFLTGKK